MSTVERCTDFVDIDGFETDTTLTGDIDADAYDHPRVNVCATGVSVAVVVSSVRT